MNTRDVRDMEHSQWAYWAAAIPVTSLVIILGLLWTGEMSNFVRWARSLRPSVRQPSRVVVNMVPDDGESQGRGSPTMRQAPSPPVIPQGPTGPTLRTIYNPGEIGSPGASGAGRRSPQAAGGGGNNLLQDYQMQLALLEQQNKKRLIMARQGQESPNRQA